MASENQSIESIVRDFVAELREKLIDPSNRNRLINFKHTDRSRRQIRVIDENPSFILSLSEGSVVGPEGLTLIYKLLNY